MFGLVQRVTKKNTEISIILEKTIIFAQSFGTVHIIIIGKSLRRSTVLKVFSTTLQVRFV